MKDVEYCIFNPGGNKTALVFNKDYNMGEKKLINDAILRKFQDVEQVGFVKNMEYDLQMAGGEFCGNATRCAVKYYLTNNNKASINIKVSGMNEKIFAGIDDEKNIWANIPYEWVEETIFDGVKIVKLSGITHIVINDRESKKYLKDKTNLKQYAKEIINKLRIKDKAVGVLFTERKENIIKLYPHCMGK